jgi:sugar/nucleoside kinase (ribokinase family)
LDGAINARAVLVIGDVMLDVVAAHRSAIEAGSDTPAAISLVPGGSGANTAAWLAYLGIAVCLVGRVGNDSFDMHAAALRAHGVEPFLARDTGARSGVVVSLVASDGERSFLTDRGANMRLARTDLPDALLDRIKLIHLSAYALATPGSRAAVLDFLAGAAARSIPISVDPGSIAVLRDVEPAAFLEWTRGARLCFPNAAEASMLTGRADPAAALAALGQLYETVAIKRGPDGAVAATAYGIRRWAAAAPAVAVVDTTGAGDAFVAGFLCGYLAGEDGAGCLRRGVDAGTTAIAQFGGRPPLHEPPGWQANQKL